MLSFYDALAFGTHKKTFIWGILLALFIGSVVIFTISFLQEKFELISIVLSILHRTPPSRSILSLLREPSFWSTLYPKMLYITAVSLACGIVFLAQELIIAKKKLFNLPPHFSLSFLVYTLVKLLFLFLPVAVGIYLYTHGVIHSIFSFGIQAARNANFVYSYPFKVSTTVCLIVGLVFYIYYAVCLFIERFSFRPLLKFPCFFRHLDTVIELMIAHVFALVLLLLSWSALFFILKNLSSYWICFSFLFLYLMTMVMSKNARFVLLLPVCIGVFVIIGCNHFLGPVFTKSFWPTIFISTLVFNLFFIFIFMFISMVAHLFAQTTFVFHFNKTPSSDVLDANPEKLNRIEDLYDDYLRTHKNSEENFFDKL